MRVSSALLALVALVGQAIAFPALHDLPKRDSGLEVKLSTVGNTRVKAVLTNTANSELSFLKLNTFFDSTPIRKVQISKDGSLLPFNGMFRYYDMKNLPQDAFKTLAPGASIETEFDIAATADLSAGGSYRVFSNGIIPVVDGKGTKPTSVISYSTNELSIDVDGGMAARVKSAIEPVPEMTIEKRTRIDQRTCSGQYMQTLQNGLRTAAGYANRAAQAAQNGDQLQRFFKTTNRQTAQNIAARFRAIAQECGSTTSGKTTYYCQDVYRGCQGSVIAYTIPARSVVVNCPAYWQLPPVVNRGFDPDHGYVVVHEFTHANSIFSPGTDDHAYGIENSLRLSPQQCLDNADNYSLYAAAVSRGG